MRRHSALSVVSTCAILLLAQACNRSFDSPPPEPPQVVLDSISPPMAFSGTRVTLTGSEFDPDPNKNEVYFGTQLAEVVAEAWPDHRGERLAVIVPVLEASGALSVRVANDSSSTTLNGAFYCLGSGHPREEALSALLDSHYAPLSVASLPQVNFPIFTILGGDAWLASWTLASAGLRFDLGTCARPVSVALAAVAWPSALQPSLQTYVSTVQLPDEANSEVFFRLLRWRLDLSALPLLIPSPEWLFSEERSLVLFSRILISLTALVY